MSNIKTKTAVKMSKATVKNEAVERALANAPVEMVPLSKLALTPLNVRKKAPDPKKMEELANSIKAVGVLQNLIVCLMPDGLLGVAAGGRRLKALDMLMSAGVITGDYAVPVKKVSEDMAKIISATENFHHEEMHSADQIAAFGDMSTNGRSAANIGGLLGYDTKHVQKCLRLAGMAPALLEALARDELDIDQLQALSASEDHDRQLAVWENATSDYYRRPDSLRDAMLSGEEAAEDNAQLVFVGRDVYEFAGGGFRYDLFTDAGFISDTVLLETLTRQKLNEFAAGIAQKEGWSWSEGRLERLSTYGEDAERYLLLSQPETQMTEDERAYLSELDLRMDELSEQGEHGLGDEDARDLAREECQQKIDVLNTDAAIRAWSDDERARSGVVVSLLYGETHVRRGVVLRSELPRTQNRELEAGEVGNSSLSVKAPEISTRAKHLSAVLVKSLSSERTLAVQAALAQQPEKALVIFVHDCMKSVFRHQSCTTSTLKVTLCHKTSVMLDNAPTSTEGMAMQTLNAMHETWQAMLPQDWHKSCDWLLTWDTQQLIAVMGYCLAGCLDGASERLSHKDSKAGKELETVEKLLDFTLRDWWLPTKANFFGRINKEQISDSLSEAGLDGAGRDVLKLKKGDAAALAEDKIVLTRWVPDCLLAVRDIPVQQEGEVFNELNVGPFDTDIECPVPAENGTDRRCRDAALFIGTGSVRTAALSAGSETAPVR